jgi:hypothetical protein
VQASAHVWRPRRRRAEYRRSAEQASGHGRNGCRRRRGR